MESLITFGSELCAIDISPDGIAVACVRGSGKPEVSVCDFFPRQLGRQPAAHQVGELLSEAVVVRFKKS